MAGRHLTLLLAGVIGLGGCAEFNYGGAPQAPRGSPGQAPTVYTVERGDTLYSIAWRYGLDYRRVARWNGMRTSAVIHPGDRLRLRPPVATSNSEPAARKRTSTAADRDDPPAASRATRSGNAAAVGDWRWPVNGRILRGFRAGSNGKAGVALAGDAGQAVHAAAGGRVVYSGNGLRGYGNLVIVKHNDRFLTAYGYNQTVLVSEGERVRTGDVIARMGRGPDGTVSLHFELRENGRPVDPGDYLPGR